MIVKSSLLLLGAAFAFAQDQVPIGGNLVCLSSDNPNDCCTGGATTGQIVLNDRNFQYTCLSKLKAMKSKGKTTDDAYDCAAECASDIDCEASAFRAQGANSRGNCFYVMGDNMDQSSDAQWITFTEVPPVPPSCLESADPNECCSEPATQKGEILIDGARWKWNCDSKLKALNSKDKDSELNPSTVHTCASLCSATEGCEGISFRKAVSTRGKCYFIMGNNKDEQETPAFITVTKIVDDDDEEDDNTPTPEPTCEEKLDDCLKNPQDSAKLTKCEADKVVLEKEKEDYRKEAEDFEQKKEEWRSKYQTCEKDKGTLSLDKQHCENDKATLSSTIIDKDEEIKALQGKLDKLQDKYDALNTDCNGEGPDGKCRTNIYDAEPRDDLCIIDGGAKQFKIYYGKRDAKPFPDLGSGSANSFKHCAERCGNYVGTGAKAGKKCLWFTWDKDGLDRSCYMMSSAPPASGPTTPNRWSSGLLV